MKINRITLTGADDKTDINKLSELSKKYPFVEWGILYSKNNNRPRYPSYEWIKKLEEANLPLLSAHLCGEFSREIMQYGNENFFDNSDNCSGMYKRIQINYNFLKSSFNLDNLWKIVEKMWAFAFIVQNNKSNNETIKKILEIMIFENIHVLHDASGGRGREIQEIPEPFNVYTGYSGGLNPDNIEEVCKKVSALKSINTSETTLANFKEPEAWLDMESGIRTNDIFDLDKVEKVLEITSKYISYS